MRKVGIVANDGDERHADIPVIEFDSASFTNYGCIEQFSSMTR